MGILGSIFGKIFNSSAAEAAAKAATESTPLGASAPAFAESAAAPAPAAMAEVDVEQLLDGMAAKASQKFNWKTSIVDLMKLLDLDSSLAARKELAKELDYTGDTNDSATMNVWLHRQVMNKLAANGGKVPADLKD